MLQLPHKPMRHTRSSALRYHNRAKRNPSRGRATRDTRRDTRARTAPLPSHAAVLSFREFGHVLSSVTPPQNYNNHAAARKEALRKRSEARYKNWGNTLEALREKKQMNRLQRLEEIERRQQIIDQREAEYQDAKRRAVIQRANQIMYLQNDRVKQFQSGLLYSDVLKAREAQIRMRARSKEEKRKEELKWVDIHKKQLQTAIAKEKKLIVEQKHKAQQLASMQLTQLAALREKNRRIRQAEIAEGERIKAAAAEALRQAKEAEIARKKQQKLNNLEYTKANEKQKKLKQALLERDRKEEEELMAFAKEKDRLLANRKRIVAERKKEQLRIQEALIDRQFQYLQDIKAQSEAKLMREEKALQEKTRNQFARKEMQRKLDLEALRKGRQQQIEARRRAEEKEKEEERIICAHWERRRKEMETLDKTIEQKELENNKQLQIAVKQQMVEKENRTRLLREAEFQSVQHAKNLQRREDAVFNEYTRAHMMDYAERGKTVKPMQLILVKEQVRAIRAFN